MGGREYQKKKKNAWEEKEWRPGRQHHKNVLVKNMEARYSLPTVVSFGMASVYSLYLQLTANL